MYIKQNDKRLYPEIQKIGCFFRAALFLAERKTRKFLSDTQINKLWDLSNKYGYIGILNGEPNCVITSAPISNLALEELGWRGRFVEVGLIKNDKISYYPSVKDKRSTDFIQKINQAGPSKTHFRVVNENKEIDFDPHNPEINSLGEIYTICYRYDK